MILLLELLLLELSTDQYYERNAVFQKQIPFPKCYIFSRILDSWHSPEIRQCNLCTEMWEPQIPQYMQRFHWYSTYSGSSPLLRALCLSCCFCLSFSSFNCNKQNMIRIFLCTHSGSRPLFWALWRSCCFCLSFSSFSQNR